MYYYINPTTKKVHRVNIHNFDRNDPSKVRIMSNCDLNPEDKHYPDKKWINTSDLLASAQFTEEFIKNHTF